METQTEYTVEVVPSQVKQTTETALAVIDAANSLMIVTVDDYRTAQGLMKTVKDRIKELTETRMEQTRPLDEAKKKIIEFFSTPLEKLERAKSYLNRVMVDFTEEQDRKRREEERRLQEEARKRAEEEALAAALEAEAAGDSEEAEQIIQEPVYVPPVKVVSEIPKSKDSHIRETWSAEVVDLKLLVKAIAEGKAPLQAVAPDMTFLNGQARSYRGALNIPGVRAVSRKTQI
jgi:hypothetical protein